MSESAVPPVSKEQRTITDFDQVVKETFANCNTIAEFITFFNEYFPVEVGYQNDLDKKLNPKVAIEEKKISCSGASLMLESFIRQRFPDQYKVLFMMDELSSKGHSVVVLLPSEVKQVTATDDELLTLIKQLASNQNSELQGYHYKKKYNFMAFDFSKVDLLAKFNFVLSSASDFIESRRMAFLMAKAVDV